MALPLPILERLSFLLTIVGGSGISNKCRSSSLRILKKIYRIKVKKLQEKCRFVEKYTYIFRLTDKFEQDAGRLIVLVVVLCTQLLYFFMIAFIRSFSKELYASSRTILRKNININSFFFNLLQNFNRLFTVFPNSRLAPIAVGMAYHDFFLLLKVVAIWWPFF